MKNDKKKVSEQKYTFHTDTAVPQIGVGRPQGATKYPFASMKPKQYFVVTDRKAMTSSAAWKRTTGNTSWKFGMRTVNGEKRLYRIS